MIFPSCIHCFISNAPNPFFSSNNAPSKPSAPEVALIPKAIDFGLVDTDVASPTRILVLRNDGSKPTRFYVDAGNSPHKIITEPFKGVVQPRSSTHIHVKVISSIVGSFYQNLWITCDKPYIVPLSGQVIRPKFEPIYDSPGMGSIVVVDFPATYVGTTSAKVLYIKNHSASDTMFCIKGEVRNNILDLNTCLNMEPDFGYFDVSPKGGMTQSKEIKVFNFRFKPLKPRHDKTLKPFHLCIYHIIRVKCKYLMSSVCIEESYASEDIGHAERMSRSSSGMFDHLKGVQTAQFLRPSAWNRSDYHITAKISDSLEIYLHAIAEEPSITVIPDEFNLDDLTVGERHVRVLEFKNNSTRLSIIIDYKKVAYVDVDKEKFSIDTKKSLQISVFITPHQIGKSMDFGDLLNDTKIKEKLLNLHSSVDEIEKIIETALTKFDYEKLSPEEKVNYDLFNAYALNVLCWMYLRTKGQDPAKTNIKSELIRIKDYMLKAKVVQDKKLRPQVNKSAAQRFIKHGLSYSDKSEAKKRKFSQIS